MAVKSTFRENAVRVIATLGLIAILLLGAWGIILLAFNLPGWLGTISFWGHKETLSVSAPALMTSDKPVAVSWKHANKQTGEYSYQITYSCAQGLSLAAPVPTGAYQLIPCNTSINFVNATSTLPVVPVLASGISKATTTITVSATKLESGTIVAKGTANTTVSASTTAVSASGTGSGSTYTPATTTKPAATAKPAATKPATSTTKPSSTYYASGRTTNLYGYADLSVQITSAPQQAQAGQRVSLQFVITNTGTNMVPAGWSFIALLPYNPVYTYPVGGQQALYPGDRIVYTLGYDAVPSGYWGNAAATIQADPNNYVLEASESNNAATASYPVY